MANKIDKLLRVLTKYKAEQLIFRTEEKPVLMIEGEIRPITQITLKTNQIIGILREIASEETQKRLMKKESLSFDYYLEGLGNFNIQTDINQDNVLAIIQKEKPQEAGPDTLKEFIQTSVEPQPEPEFPPPPSPEDFQKPLPRDIPPLYTAEPPDHKRELNLHKLFKTAVDQGASDLYLCAGSIPKIRINNNITICRGQTETSSNELKEAFYKYMKREQISKFESERVVEFSLEMSGLGRFRAKAFMDLNGIGAVFRPIPSSPPTFAQLGAPGGVKHLCELDKGLVLVTGPPSSGKSNTVAAIVEHINQTYSKHIITLERPAEFVYKSFKSVITQWEVNLHTPSIECGLKAGSIISPDILVIDRLDNPYMIRSALEMAESGILVITTLHTDSVISSIDFIISSFPESDRDHIRHLLSKNLKGIVSQALLASKSSKTRVAAFEVLLHTPLASNLINANKQNQIPGIIKANHEHGMINLGDSLLEMVRNNVVTAEEAYDKSVDKIAFSQLLQMSSIKLNLHPRFYN